MSSDGGTSFGPEDQNIPESNVRRRVFPTSTPSNQANPVRLPHIIPNRSLLNSTQPLPRLNPVGDIFNARVQLSEAFFRRAAASYARVFPTTARRIIEFVFLLQAFLVLALFVHLHLAFVRSPITCLDKLRSDSLNKQDPNSDSFVVYPDRNHYAAGHPNAPHQPWPRDGILRVEVIQNVDPSYSLVDSYAKEYYAIYSHSGTTNSDDEFITSTNELDESSASTTTTTTTNNPDIRSSFLHTPPSPSADVSHKSVLYDASRFWTRFITFPIQFYNYLAGLTPFILPTSSTPSSLPSDVTTNVFGESATTTVKLSYRSFMWLNMVARDTASNLAIWFSDLIRTAGQMVYDLPHWFGNFPVATQEESYIIEYALEYGFLRLSPAIRQRLNISVTFVVLNPQVDACFGSPVHGFLFHQFLGYNDVLMGSVKYLANSESIKGHVANVVTGQHYRWVSSQMPFHNCLVATLVMILFTFCVSVLLRYSSHQLIMVITDILQFFESNVTVGLPATPLLTVILALVAIETIMSEFFGDSFTAFYVILIVSICDHYEAMFCRTEISRRYWPAFFYLYHFAFYAYHYRFNGQFSCMALWVSWLFTLHSMIYFFHHYELPNLLSDFTIHIASTQDSLSDHVQIVLHPSLRSSVEPSSSEPARNPSPQDTTTSESVSGNTEPVDRTDSSTTTPRSDKTPIVDHQQQLADISPSIHGDGGESEDAVLHDDI